VLREVGGGSDHQDNADDHRWSNGILHSGRPELDQTMTRSDGLRLKTRCRKPLNKKGEGIQCHDDHG
jgi:hypothetical protein